MAIRVTITTPEVKPVKISAATSQIVDLNNQDIVGLGIFADATARNAVPVSKQTEGYLAAMKDTDKLLIYKGGGWTDANNWGAVASSGSSNLSGEVTSNEAGVATIASNVVDEDNLKISNSPQNGYLLSAESGNTGGLTWVPSPSGTTNLSNTTTQTAVTVVSSSGSNTDIASASTSQAGVMTKAKFDEVVANTAKVSADGAVTTHSDVTNAGSGLIITDAERTKLNGIQAGAQADQTGAEIKAAYEAETNAFTDAQFTKLAGIEASADVTDAANVNSAGAVMNSDLGTKGQILVGDGDGDPAALSVGTNNYVLTADSGETTGVKWAAAPTELSADTSPQLGGNLDVQAREINTSTTNGNIILDPNGTGVVEVKGTASTNSGSIKLNCSENSHGVTIESPAHSDNGTYKLILPVGAGGTAGQVLKVGTLNSTDHQLAFTTDIAGKSGGVQGQDLAVSTNATALDTAGEAEGVIVKFGDDATTAGSVYTFASGTWTAVSAVANGEATTEGLLGVALGANSTTHGMLIHGVAILSFDAGSVGDVLYINPTAGQAGKLTFAIPTASNTLVRIAGHMIAENSGASKIFFSPSQDYVKNA